MQHTPGIDAKRTLLDKLLRGEITALERKTPTVTRRSGDRAPLSYNQEQVYLEAQAADRVAPDSRPFNETITIHRSGPLDLEVLERSLLEILRRHQAWRTTFEPIGNTVIQRIHACPELDLNVVDLRHFSEPQKAALEIAQERAQKPFDLARGPLIRFQLIRLEEEDYQLFLAAHQIVVDGVSVYNVFLSELVALYEAFSAGRPSPVPEPSIQYSDYAHWQRDTLANGRLSEHLHYWQEQLAGGLQMLRMPTDRPRPAIQSFRGAIQPFAIPKRLSDAAKALTKVEGSTVFITLLAAFTMLLHNYTRQEEIVVGTVAPTRSCSEIQDLLGYFLNPVVLRLSLTGNPTFREIIARTREIVLGALSHAEMPFHLLLAATQCETDLNLHPLYQVQFSLEPPITALCPGWNLTPMDLQSGGARLDLYLVLDDRREGMFGRVQYNPDLFKAASMDRMVRHYQALLESVLAEPDGRISKLSRFSFYD